MSWSDAGHGGRKSGGVFGTDAHHTGFRNICNRAYITYAGVYVIGPIYVMAYM